MKGGPEAVVSALVLFIIMLLWERKRLLDQLTRKDDKLDQIVDEYQESNKIVADALKSLTAVMYEIKGRLF